MSQERSKVQDGWIRVDGFSSNLERKLGNGVKEATGMSITTLLYMRSITSISGNSNGR